jgi:hypothetical protein
MISLSSILDFPLLFVHLLLTQKTKTSRNSFSLDFIRHAANAISIPPHSSYGYCRRPCAPSRLSLSPSSRALKVLPKSLAPVLPLAIRFKDVSNDVWSDELTERPSASVLTSPGSCATAQFTPRSRGIKMLAFRVDTVENVWLDCKIYSSVWIEHPPGISTMPTEGSSAFG